MLVSPIPGLIVQMALILIRKRYKYATIYIDQATKLGYTYLQPDSTVETILKGKYAFKQYTKIHSVIIKAYHADNGVFYTNRWVNNCISKY